MRGFGVYPDHKMFDTCKTHLQISSYKEQRRKVHKKEPKREKEEKLRKNRKENIRKRRRKKTGKFLFIFINIPTEIQSDHVFIQSNE